MTLPDFPFPLLKRGRKTGSEWIRRHPRTMIFAAAAIPASITLALVTDSHTGLKTIYGLGAYVMLVVAFEEAS